MQFKRLVAGICAAAIAVTQTAIVPISVGATEYNYEAVPGFDDSCYGVALGSYATTGTVSWDNDSWYSSEPVEPTANTATYNKATGKEGDEPSPKDATNVGFYFSCEIDEEKCAVEVHDAFDFTVEGLTVTLKKYPGGFVPGETKTVLGQNDLTEGNPIYAEFPNVCKDSKITVTYSVSDAEGADPSLAIQNTNGISIGSGSDFDPAGNTFEVTLYEGDVGMVDANGFQIVGKDVTVNNVTVSTPDHSATGEEPQEEILVNNETKTWTQTRASGWYEGNLEFDLTDSSVKFDNFGDFYNTGSLTATWTSISAESKRISFDSINTELWSGNENLGNWSGTLTLPTFSYAKKFSRLTITYEVNPPIDTEEWDAALSFKNIADGSWDNIVDLHINQFEDGTFPLDKEANSITITLTQKAADILKSGGMVIMGSNVTLKSITSLDVDSENPITETAIDENNFPNQTFREFVKAKCNSDNDNVLTSIEASRVREIFFSAPPENEDERDPNAEYADEIYQQIDSFKGVEYLPYLERFEIGGNKVIESVDLSDNTNLRSINLDQCEKLSTLTLPDSAPNLEHVNLCGTKVTEFDGTNYSGLKELYAGSDYLESVDVSANTNLKSLGIWGANREKFFVLSDLSNNTKLTYLTVAWCGIERIDVSALTNLEVLDVSGNCLAAIDLTGLTKLKSVVFDKNASYITLLNSEYNLDLLGIDPKRFALKGEQDVTLGEGNVLTVDSDVEEILYTYDTGIKGEDNKPVYFDGKLVVNGKSFNSVNATLWKGNRNFADWDGCIHVPAFNLAAKGVRLTIEYSVNETPDSFHEDGTWDPLLLLNDSTTGEWVPITGIHPDQDDYSNIVLDKDSTSVTVVLTEEAANALASGLLFINGCNITVTEIKSSAPVEEELIDINDVNFPSEELRTEVKKADANDDNKLSVIELSKIRELILNDRNIASLGGIEHLTYLRVLEIRNNKSITALDVSMLTKLEVFDASDCEKLATVKLPAKIQYVYLSNTSVSEFDATEFKSLINLFAMETNITEIDVTKNPELEQLFVNGCSLTGDIDISKNPKLEKFSAHGCGLKALDVSNNPKLKELYIGDCENIALTGFDKLENLTVLHAYNCGFTKIDVSKNKNLESLVLFGNKLAALDLSGLDKLAAAIANAGSQEELYEIFNIDGQNIDIRTLNNTYDLNNLSALGLDPAKVTLADDQKATLKEGIITFEKEAESVTYYYNTGITGRALTVTLNVTGNDVSKYVVSYKADKKTVTSTADTWTDVLKLINDKNTSYTITINSDDTVDALTFPAATKAKSVTLEGGLKTITTKSTSVTLPTDVTLNGVTIKAVDKDGNAAKSFTLSASKNLTISSVKLDAAATTIKGGAKSVLEVQHYTTVDSVVSGFGTLNIQGVYGVTFNKNVTVKDLKFIQNGTVKVGENAVLKFTNIDCGTNGGKINYTSEEYTPVAVTNITGEAKLQIGIYYQKPGTGSEPVYETKFASGDVVLNSKTVDLSKIDASYSLPEGTTLGKSGKSGNEVTVMETVMEVYDGTSTVKYAQWSDVLSTIAADAKAAKAANSKNPVYKNYTVTLSAGLNANGAFKMPAANTYKSLKFKSASEAQTITFTGNLSLTGKTTFENVKLAAKKGETAVDFSITAGKNELKLKNVTAEKSIKSISSSGIVTLEGVTVGTVTAATVNIKEPYVPGSVISSESVNSWAANTPVANKSSVIVNGNLTAKTALNLNGAASSLTVNGVLNAAEIKAENSDAVLVVKQPAKGNALVIGKNGFNGTSKQIKFVLADANGNAAKIEEDVILGTIAGTYADDLIPSNDNLAEDNSYYIVKEGKNLKAVPKTSVTATDEITVTINGKDARYKDINEAIKDISASGKATDEVVIKITANTFKDTIAKLPLPTAGKYGSLTYEADSPVTIKVTSDLALTGNLNIDSDITINKVGKDGKTTAISVNVGKYQFAALGVLSATEVAPTPDSSTSALAAVPTAKSQIANISGNGIFATGKNVIVTGKVNGTSLVLGGNTVKLEGDKASFAGGIFTEADATLAYTNAKNIKFTIVRGLPSSSLILDTTAAENAVIAAITGDYTKDAIKIKESELKVVRSGNNLKAVKAENVVEVVASNGKPTTNGTRTYDSLANAMNDISRIKDTTATYTVKVKEGNELVLPKAKTYGKLVVTTAGNTPVTIKTTKDLVLTGDLVLGPYVTLNKVAKNSETPAAISVNVGNYEFVMNGKLSPKENVSQIVNISGKGAILVNDAINVSGKVNVGEFTADKTTLSAKSSFAAAKIEVYPGNTLSYPMSIAKNVKFGEFTRPFASLKLDITDVAAGQIAALTGNFVDGSVVIGDGTAFKAVRSGNKLMAVKADAEVVTVHENGEIKRVYDTYANAVADINRINYKDGQYIVTLPGDMTASKLALPAKGKYKSIRFIAYKAVTIDVKSDIALTGDLVIGENVTLRKNGGNSALKITSPKNKDGSPVYTVTVLVGGKIVNGTLNGKEIENPSDIVYTVGHNFGDGIELKPLNGLAFNKTNVAEGGKIVVTFKEPVSGSFTLVVYHNGIDGDPNEPIDNKTINGATKVEFTLTGYDANLITNNLFLFVSEDTDCIVTSVEYVAPETT